MRFYKLRVTPNAASIATSFNEQFKPEIIPETNDPYSVDWITSSDEPFLVGEDALRLSNPEEMGYVVRWPIYGGNFNTRDYPSQQVIFNDIETIFREALKQKGIEPSTYKESLAATYGAGISNACVVDMGAVKTSIACVDDGMVIADTRMVLSMGGNDITEFLYVLLEKIGFPYRDINLARSYDWNVMEDLKARICTLAEGDVALNLYDFYVRRPGKPTEKYGLRAYDEIILAPLCLFEPRVIEFHQKRAGMRFLSRAPDIAEEMLEENTEGYTKAMLISTQHLFPVLMSHNHADQSHSMVTPVVQTPATEGPWTTSTPLPASASGTTPVTPAGEEPPSATGGAKDDDVEMTDATAPATESTAPSASGAVDENSSENKTADAPPPADGDAPSNAAATSASDAPIEIIDVDEVQAAIPVGPPPEQQQRAAPAVEFEPIDVSFEASMLPLDVAIFNSARAAGGDEKIRKYLQAVLVVGGTALVPGMVHALESRCIPTLQAIATPLVPNMEKVQIIPPPKDVDPAILVWKGAAVLGKMDGVADLWITAADWVGTFAHANTSIG
ncbi:hypothetical protein BN946_scf185008.g115 [Trametes cinnabarina]|uniref:Uncharacterized protein n=1 Tax=Pycnoporus cinnabarinus TaxID=5643 RepID=A0A060SFT7_PYCCI|nr:hypothetical protein BN946_scf185008.g115 [Trametes cinnabarina]